MDACLKTDMDACLQTDMDACLQTDMDACLKTDMDACLQTDMDACLKTDMDACLKTDMDASRAIFNACKRLFASQAVPNVCLPRKPFQTSGLLLCCVHFYGFQKRCAGPEHSFAPLDPEKNMSQVSFRSIVAICTLYVRRVMRSL